MDKYNTRLRNKGRMLNFPYWKMSNVSVPIFLVVCSRKNQPILSTTYSNICFHKPGREHRQSLLVESVPSGDIT